jgi:hypothetical protein
MKKNHPVLKLPNRTPFTDLAKAYPKAFSSGKGLVVRTVPREGTGYELSQDGKKCVIAHNSTSDLFRALGQWLARGAPEFSEEPRMDFRGLMIDASRNAVMKPEKLREVILRLALFGYNALCLYTEDTSEVRGHPEIGYLRGRYTQGELRELDRYARKLGIEMFPCIQTLGHLQTILSKQRYANLRDTPSILNLKVDETRPLLEEIIENVTRPYASRKIHLGLDETGGLGLGRAFTPNTPIDPREDYLTHVNWLADLCRKKGLEPMMWGDMLIGASGTEAFADEHARKLPRDMKMVFWDYYKIDHEYYRRTIRQFRQMGFEPLVAPGLWSWGRLWGSQEITDASAHPFMVIAREEGVREALMTMWAEDGCEAPFASSYPALGQFADDCWRSEPVRDDTSIMVEAICGTPFDTYTLPSRLDYYPHREKGGIRFGANLRYPYNTLGKGILWDDPLLGTYSRQYEGILLQGRFEDLARKITGNSRSASPRDAKLLGYAGSLARAIAQKADLHNRARRAYLEGRTGELERISASIPRVIRSVKALMGAHWEIWREERKPFGFEVLQLHYGGQLARLDQMKKRLDDYLTGNALKIDEFDEKTVKIWPEIARAKTRYHQIATSSVYM